MIAMHWPKDAPKNQVIRSLERLGFKLVREREHIAMARDNLDGSKTILILPNHSRIKCSTLRSACSKAKITRAEFLTQYYK